MPLTLAVSRSPLFLVLILTTVRVIGFTMLLLGAPARMAASSALSMSTRWPGE